MLDAEGKTVPSGEDSTCPSMDPNYNENCVLLHLFPSIVFHPRVENSTNNLFFICWRAVIRPLAGNLPFHRNINRAAIAYDFCQVICSLLS